MRVKVEDVRIAAQNAVDHTRKRRAELKEEYLKEKAELDKSWWYRWFGEESSWDHEHVWYGLGALNKGEEFLSALKVVAEDTVELTVDDANFVSNWINKRTD